MTHGRYLLSVFRWKSLHFFQLLTRRHRERSRAHHHALIAARAEVGATDVWCVLNVVCICSGWKHKNNVMSSLDYVKKDCLSSASLKSTLTKIHRRRQEEISGDKTLETPQTDFILCRWLSLLLSFVYNQCKWIVLIKLQFKVHDINIYTAHKN